MLSRSLAFLCIISLASCLNSSDYDIDSVTLTPEMAFPLASGDISILDLMSSADSTYLKVDQDGVLYLSYSQTLASQEIRNLFSLPDNNSNTLFNLPAGTLPPSSVDTPAGSVDKLLDLNLSPEQLTEILLKSGSLNYNVSITPPNGVSPTNLPIEVDLVLTDIVDKTTLQPMSFSVGTGTGTRSLQDFVMKLDMNKFHVSLNLVLKSRANSFFVAANTKVNVYLSFSGLNFSYVKGFFGDQVATLPPQTVDITFFNSSLNKSNISFVQPTVKMSVSNDYGVPCEVTFTKLEARKPSSTLPLQITPASPITLGFPTLMGMSSTTTVAVNNAQSIINFSPAQLYYAASARINKGISSGSNFLADTSKLRVTLGTEVPLYGKASNVVLSDTIDLDLGGIKESSILNASLKVSAVNEMPLDAYMQFYLADSLYTTLDSLFTTNQTYLVKASKVLSSGELDKGSGSEVTINLDPVKINKLFSSKHIIIKSILNTTKDSNGTLLNVKFKSSYKLKLSLGLLAKIEIKAE